MGKTIEKAANPLAKKMRLKRGLRAAIINAPEGYAKSLSPLPEGVSVAYQLSGQFDWIQVFVKTKAEIDRQFPQVLKALKPKTLIWISFPKGKSKIQTDLTRDKGWDTVRQADLKWTNLISVDDMWSAFSLRPYKPGEEHKSFR